MFIAALVTVLATTVTNTLADLLPGVDAPDPPASTDTHPAPGDAACAAPSTTPASIISDIPGRYLCLYSQAAAHACPGLSWTVLAAVGKIESDHGRSRLPGVAPGTVNTAGAGGVMQFLDATFRSVVARYPPPPGGAQPPSRYNVHDAIHTAAAYLCDSGANRGDLRAALFTYNHSQTYVDQVLAQARRYQNAARDTRPTNPPDSAPGSADRAPPNTAPPTQPNPGRGPNSAGAAALAFARAQIGQPYLWGGDGPAAGEGGFDCSGLTRAAYAAAGIQIPRTAQTQYHAGPLLPTGTPAQPGDLVFFGTTGRIHHVGIALGQATLMIHAPDRGQVVRISDWRTMRDVAGLSRPVNRPRPQR